MASQAGGLGFSRPLNLTKKNKSMNTDITSRRHGGNVQSELAFERAVQSGQIKIDRLRVLAEVKSQGTHGLTCKELAKKWGVDMNRVSGRFSELKKRGKIRKVQGLVRLGSAVCVAC